VIGIIRNHRSFSPEYAFRITSNTQLHTFNHKVVGMRVDFATTQMDQVVAGTVFIFGAKLEGEWYKVF